jgi:hypothetical protein
MSVTFGREAFFARMRARIMRNVVMVGDCWLWTGRRNNGGYAVMAERLPGYRTPRPLLAHRVAWEAFRRRRVPRGRVCAHDYRCIGPHCVNFAHIRATTQSSNNRDRKRAAKWRLRRIRIEFPPTHSLKVKRTPYRATRTRRECH